MLELENLLAQPVRLRLLGFFVAVHPLSAKEFYEIRPKSPSLNTLLSVICKPQVDDLIRLYVEINGEIWLKKALFLGIKKGLKAPDFVIKIIVFTLFKTCPRLVLFKIIADLNALITHLDHQAWALMNPARIEIDREEALDNYVLNFVLIRKILGNKINNQDLSLSTLNDVLTFPQAHYLNRSRVLLKALQTVNAQLSVEDKDLKKQCSYFAEQYEDFKLLMQSLFGDISEDRFFDEDIENRFKQGSGNHRIKLYDIFKNIKKQTEY